jgi:hypothetical protein
MKTFIKTLLLVLILFSCEQNKLKHNPNPEGPQSYAFSLWVTKIDVCNKVLTSIEKRKVLFVLDHGVIGIALSETERIVLLRNFYEGNEKIHVFYSEHLSEPFTVSINQSEDGFIVFVTPLLTQEVTCQNRVNTTAYIFSSQEPKK